MLYSGKNLSGLYSDFNNAYDSESMEAVSSDPPQKYYTLYLLFIVIYISGGFTYAGIFPKFEPYTFIAKYYNVQPLFFTVLIAGALADLVGRKTMLYIGFGMVGLSFTAFMMPASYVSYFLTQTCTQIGWGFVNTYVWTVSADMSNHYGKRHIAARGVACMLFGTVLGAVLAHFFNQAQVTHDALYAAATLIPIFVGLIIVNLIPETLRFDLAHTQDYDFSVAENGDSKADQLYSHMEALNALTSREREIAMLLIEDMTRNEICQTLNISINTLKTHIRHIYKKLDVTSKEGLRQKVS
jgi:DNA-binding CsgD family transcriptional regulator